jgi:hypothetical protein
MTAKVPVVVSEPPPAPAVKETTVMEAAVSDSGPRSSGVRRSSERARGKSKNVSTEEGSFE